MKTHFPLSLPVLAGAVVLACMSACTRQPERGDIDWAQAALARNAQFEILATDENSRVITVRDKSDGTVRTLRVDELIAAPPPARLAAAPAPHPGDATAPAPAAGETAVADTAQPAAPLEQTTETVAVERAGTGQSLAEGPGYSITRSTGESPGTSDTPQTMEGPGYSITREEPVARQSGTRAETVVAGNVQHRNEPIRCQGNRLMRIDGETFEFSGDAVIAEDGCDLYISNARIRANGVGIIARQARVHIVNSTIGGSRGSYEVSDGAEIYVARSTFAGVGRRFDTATMNDLGGNQYRLNH